MEPERVINLVRKYGTPASRLNSRDEFLGFQNLFIEKRRLRINLLFFGSVFDAVYMMHYSYPNEEVTEGNILHVEIFRPGKWVERLEKAVDRIENKEFNRRFSPVKDW